MGESRIPGYTGHVHGERESFGATYAATTGALANGQPAPGTSYDKAEEGRQFVVGYTGHIPLARDMIGKTYKHQADIALAAHARAVEDHARTLASGSMTPALRDTIRRGRSLPPISAKPLWPSGADDSCDTSSSDCPDPASTSSSGRIPGYTGFVPLYRDQSLGHGFGVATKDALGVSRLPPAQRVQRLRTQVTGGWSRAGSSGGVTGERSTPLPGFTGHVPGRRDVLGHTFTVASSVALREFVREQRVKNASEILANKDHPYVVVLSKTTAPTSAPAKPTTPGKPSSPVAKPSSPVAKPMSPVKPASPIAPSPPAVAAH